MYRVGLDISALSPDFKEHALRGIGRYVYELDKFFTKRLADDSAIESSSIDRLSVRSFRHEEFAPPRMIDSMIEKFPFGKQTIRQQFLFPLHVTSKTKSRFDVLHFPAHMDAPSWSIRDYVITVLDLIPLVLSDIYKADKPSWRFHLARFLEIRAIKNARHILAISENTARDVHRILGIPMERISVTPLGVDEGFFQKQTQNEIKSTLARYKIESEASFVLYVGGIDQRKNINGLIRTFSKVVKAYQIKGEIIPKLVLVGKIDQDGQYIRLKNLIRDEEVSDYVIELGFVPDEDLKKLYTAASVFFFPSLYEGFGLPPLEAMACGAPVVCSNTSSLPEVLGNAALMVDPENYDQCAQAIMSIIDNPTLSLELREKGPVQAKKFTWKATGEATLKVYEKMRHERE